MSEKIERHKRKMRTGIVVSSAMNKSIVVRVDRKMQHPLYKKTIQKSAKLYAHDEQNIAGVGDRVRVMETRPLSLRKRWRLVEIVEKAK